MLKQWTRNRFESTFGWEMNCSSRQRWKRRHWSVKPATRVVVTALRPAPCCCSDAISVVGVNGKNETANLIISRWWGKLSRGEGFHLDQHHCSHLELEITCYAQMLPVGSLMISSRLSVDSGHNLPQLNRRVLLGVNRVNWLKLIHNFASNFLLFHLKMWRFFKKKLLSFSSFNVFFSFFERPPLWIMRGVLSTSCAEQHRRRRKG